MPSSSIAKAPPRGPFGLVSPIGPLACLLLALALALPSCGGGAGLDARIDYETVPAPLANEEPVKGGEIVLAAAYLSGSMNPYGPSDASAQYLASFAFDALVELDPLDGASIRPALAASWTLSADGREIVFSLRKALWSDGSPVTVDDVLFTMESFAMNPAAGGNELPALSPGGIPARFEKAGEGQIKLVLAQASGTILQVLAKLRILPKLATEALLAAAGMDPNALLSLDGPLAPIPGTGAFIPSAASPGELTFAANPYYWKKDAKNRPLPYAASLVLIVPPMGKVAALVDGSLDAAFLSSSEYLEVLDAISANDALPLVALEGLPTRPTPSPLHLAFNYDASDERMRALFRDTRFRRAIEASVDRGRYIGTALGNFGVAGCGIVLPGNGDFHDEKADSAWNGFDLTEAAKLFDELGLPIAADGYRAFPDGRRLVLKLLVSSYPEDRAFCDLFMEAMSNLQIQLDVETVDDDWDRAMDGDFDMALMAFANQPDPGLRSGIWEPGADLYYWHRSLVSPGGASPVFDAAGALPWELELREAFERGASTMDQKARFEAYARVQAIYAAELPVIFVAKQEDLLAASKLLGNVSTTKEGFVAFYPPTLFKRSTGK